MSELCDMEIEVLEMLDGRREIPQPAAWVNACVGFLAGFGMCSKVYPHNITERGRQYLRDRDERAQKGER